MLKERVLKRISFVAVMMLAMTLLVAGQSRSIINFNKDWKFHQANDSNASRLHFDDASWRKLHVPHDWSIESDFSASFPATNQGGGLPGGIGWYRKTFSMPGGSKGKQVLIRFDGVYRNSEVWINGHSLGMRPNGYAHFQYDLTPYLLDDASNVISVKVDNSEQPDSRWYTGSGIYRDVQLIITSPTAFAQDDYFLHTPWVSKAAAVVQINAAIQHKTVGTLKAQWQTTVFDASGNAVAKAAIPLKLKQGNTNYVQKINVPNPRLWSDKEPYLYKVVSRLVANGEALDEITTTMGIRSIRFAADNGFYLNGEHSLLKGVCMHHDLGALGAAFYADAARRQLQILKDMGCNAIRFSHNPPAAAMLSLCDEMGFLVIDEAFDMWRKRKNKYDYHTVFDVWHKADLEAMVKRDRNHPSVISWSIGNEIREQFDSTGITITNDLVGIVKTLDTTRPVICALTENYPDKNFIFKSGALDILGFNYKLKDYDSLPIRFPGMPLIATETASALASRGAYDDEAHRAKMWPPDSKSPFVAGNADKSVSAYDHVYAYWGSTHEKGWLAVKERPFMAGIFVWSGFDFLGEPVPYAYPARSAYYGIVDLAGFPKDVYYMYQSEWADKPVLHLLPHWDWLKGDTVSVWAYYNQADEVELYLNDSSLGRRSKDKNMLHVSWQVPYKAGALKAVAYRNGAKVNEAVVKTAGVPARIVLEADKKELRRGTTDLSFVTVKLVDQDGNIVPHADQELHFSLLGAGKILGTDNGYQADTRSLQALERSTWKGLALAIIGVGEGEEPITLRVSSAGLAPVELHFTVK